MVECVPNYSEGRDKAKVERIVAAIKEYPVEVIDVEMNYDHNRSVITVVGDGNSVSEAIFSSIKKAAEIIDLNTHRGEHPRFGATDVVPFVPLLGTPMEYCVDLAVGLAKRVGEELNIPVYLYGKAARSPERRELPDIRNEKFQYEQLKESIGSDAKYLPDFGPKVVGPAGATIIGAREFLIAFNVDVKPENLKLAKDIAKRTRERGGVLKNVRALGFDLKETNEAQVSMNLVNYKETPLPQVFEFVKGEAEARGLQVSRSELVGLIPLEAMEEVYRFYLRNRDFSIDQVIEKRLLDIYRRESLTSYLSELASDKPAPGGGSASGIVGAFGAALISMVAGLTIGKKGYEESTDIMRNAKERAENVMWKLYRQAELDTKSYNELSAALQMPKGTEEEKAVRARTIQEKLKIATEIPYETGRLAASLFDLVPVMLQKGNKNAISDIYCAGLFLYSSVMGSMQNVKINISLIKDTNVVQDYRAKMEYLVNSSQSMIGELMKNMWK
ncbi:MAG: glutamate formimidoyltransferase [Thermoplasmatales archaeon]